MTAINAPTQATPAPRTAELVRTTRETDIRITLTLDGSGNATIDTGLGFLDHMLTALAKHARFDLTLTCKGDTHIDDHHAAEDCALALGQCLDEALGDRAGIARFASAYAPLDESLARVVIDLAGRPWAEVDLALVRPNVGEIACENITHFFESFATAARCALHVDLLRGRNDHHKAEAAFKACALALAQAVAHTGSPDIPSTKGVL